jgi:thioredoxin 2
MAETTRSQEQRTSTVAACPKCLKLNRIDLARAKTRRPVCGACQTEFDFHEGVLNVGTEQLRALIKGSPLPVIVDFWAPWCAPCRAFAPTFTQVAQEEAGRATFVKLNTEADAIASQAFGIRGIPTLAVFRQGQELERQAGAFPYQAFKAWVGRHLFQ